MNSVDLKLHRLLDRPGNPLNIESRELNTEQWLGAVYYNIFQFESSEGTQYLLFGFDGKSFFSKRKVLDVLKFREGKPVFGSPVFVKQKENEAHGKASNWRTKRRDSAKRSQFLGLT